MVLGREVFSCHLPEVEQLVDIIVDDFHSHRPDSMCCWACKNGKDTYVSYLAVRDASGSYLGTLELVWDMEFTRQYFEKRQGCRTAAGQAPAPSRARD